MSKQQTIVQAARQFESGIVKSVVDLALDVCNAVTAVWDDMDLETAKSEAELITADTPKASRGPRTTEWKDFVYAACECDLAGAIKTVNGGKNKLTRVKLFSLAKKLRSASSRTAAITATFAKGAGSGAGRVATIGMGLGVIKNTDTPPKGMTKAKLNAFRRDLKALCDEHGIAY